MVSKQDDDNDYWFGGAQVQQSFPSFSFDDDTCTKTENQQESLFSDLDTVFNSTLEISNTLPLRALISQKDLDLVLEKVTIPKLAASENIETTLYRLHHNESISLQNYRTLDQKTSLLDKTIEVCDGNLILKVILQVFVRTLKPTIFLRILAKRPIALEQYTNYLVNTNRLTDLGDLYNATGNLASIANVFYLSTRTSDRIHIRKKLDQFFVEHVDNVADNYEKCVLQDYKKFLQLKVENNLSGNTPIEALAELCHDKVLRNENPNDQNVLDFVKLMNVSELQLEWIMLNAIAANAKWSKFNEVFCKTNWITKKNVFKSVINLELMIMTLHKHGAANDLLEDLLSKLADVERSAWLARKLQCHNFVIDTLIAKRDRLGLISYKNNIPGQSEYAVKIQNALLSDKKWIN